LWVKRGEQQRQQEIQLAVSGQGLVPEQGLEPEQAKQQQPEPVLKPALQMSRQWEPKA
jgi:hypothetical protein